MKLYGLQKMTLLDFPGRVACTLFLGGCDFRCPFCHNYDLATGRAPAALDEAELMSFLKKRRGLIDGVAITGGEPCLNRDLPGLIRKIRDLGYPVKLDTNGAHPEMLNDLLGEGLLDYVAMDVKNSPEKYALTAGVEKVDLQAIRKSVDLLMNNPVDCEFRTTVVRELHEDRDFESIGAWIHGARRYRLQIFTDRDTVPYKNLHAPTREEVLRWAGIMRSHVADTRIRGMD